MSERSDMSKATLNAGLWSLLAALALAAGCNFAPKSPCPRWPKPPAYKETNDWKTAEPADAVIKGKWWEMFNDPQLNALEEQVAISNQTVVGALENFLAARAVAEQARSQLYPTVTVDPGFLDQTSPQRGRFRHLLRQFIDRSRQQRRRQHRLRSYTLPLDASWEPDLWGSIRNTVGGQRLRGPGQRRATGKHAPDRAGGIGGGFLPTPRPGRIDRTCTTARSRITGTRWR